MALQSQDYGKLKVDRGLLPSGRRPPPSQKPVECPRRAPHKRAEVIERIFRGTTLRAVIHGGGGDRRKASGVALNLGRRAWAVKDRASLDRGQATLPWRVAAFGTDPANGPLSVRCLGRRWWH